MAAKKSDKFRHALVPVLASCIASLTITASHAAYFYNGKRLTAIVGYAPGGGIDTTARMFLRHFGKHIAGSPDIVVQNMPGAAAMVARNYLNQRAPKDGSVISFEAWSPLQQIVKLPQVRFDYRKMVLIGALRGGPYVMFARKDIVPGGLARSQDIMKAVNLVYSGQQPGLTLDIHGRLALNLLGVKYKYVSGYKGARAIRLAIARGEANVTTHGLQGYRSGVEPTMVKQGIVVPLWYFPHRDKSGTYVKSPLVKDFPMFQEVYKQVRGEKYDSLEWKALELATEIYATGPNQVWGPPGMDARALPPLRKAFVATMADAAFRAEQQKVFKFEYEYVAPEVIQEIIAKFDKIDPAVVGYFQKLLRK